MFGPCKSCLEKDSRHADTREHYEARISELKAQIADLRSLVLPTVHKKTLPLIHLEANSIMSGSDEVIPLTQEQSDELDAIDSEASRLFAGNY